MSSTVRPEGSRAGSPRWQISLANLMLLVLAAGVATSLARSARDVWWSRTVPAGSNPSVPLERTVGVVLEVVAVLLILMLVKTLISLIFRCRLGAGNWVVLLSAIAWRIAAVSALVFIVAREWGILRIDYMTLLKLSQERPGWREGYSEWQAMLPVCGLLAMLGLCLGMGAGGILEGPATRRPRPYWLFVPLSALAGLLFLAQPNGRMLIPPLVLLALEAVSNAMPHVIVPTPSLATRLVRAGTDAGVAGIVCLALALMVARDFEKARRSESWGMTWRGRLTRLLALLATIAVGTYIVIVTIPSIHPRFADGFRQILGLAEALTVMGGFSIFAAGLAARALAGRPSPESARRFVGLSTLIPLGVLSLLCLSALKSLPHSFQFVSGVPPGVVLLLDGVQRGHNWLWSLLPDPVTTVVQHCLDPELLGWCLPMLGLVLLIGELVIRPASWIGVPFDALAESAASAFQFLWLTMALTIVCLAAMPILIVASQTLVYIQLRAEDWLTGGWHSVF